MKKFIEEFKAFISRGNVLDMAIGVIIATAFGKITTSLVNDVFMPFIGWIFGGVDLTERLNLVVKAEELAEDGSVAVPATVIGFGTFLGTIIDFVLVALIVFLIVKAFNKAHELAEKRNKAAEAEAEAEPEEEKEPEPSKEELLLAEIRDLLKDKQ